MHPSIAAAVSAVALIAGCSSPHRAGSGSATGETAVSHQGTAADVEALKSTEPLATTRALLFVNGLGCPLCATNVDVQLKRLKGVQDARVDLGAGTVLITMPGDTRPSPSRLARAVEDAGFTLVKIEQK